MTQNITVCLKVFYIFNEFLSLSGLEHYFFAFIPPLEIILSLLQALPRCAPYGTIFLLPGTYSEHRNVIITKPINIIGIKCSIKTAKRLLKYSHFYLHFNVFYSICFLKKESTKVG
jgi:hypothetical protein